MRSNIIKISIFFAFILASFNAVLSQTLNMQTVPSDKWQVTSSFDKPFLADESNDTFYGVSNTSFNVPITKDFNIIGNVPIIIDQVDGYGNIFLGIQGRLNAFDNYNSTFSFGGFLPTAKENRTEYGAFTDLYGIQKYLPNTLTTYFNFAIHKKNIDGFNYGIEIGVDLMVPSTEADKSRDTELNGHYGVNAGYKWHEFLFNTELLGVVFLSEDEVDFDEKFKNSVAFGAQWRGSFISPKLFIRFI